MNHKRLILLTLCVLALVALPLMTACGQPTAPAGEQPTTPAATTGAKTISIGYLGGITGWFSVREIPDMNQLMITKDLINEQGGITVNGEKYLVDIVVADYQSDFNGIVSAANSLIFDKGIKLIIGPMCVFAPAIAELCDKNQVLRILCWCNHTPGELDANTPYSFMGGNSVIAGSLAQIRYMKATYPNVKKVVICTPDDAVTYLAPMVQKLLENEGITVVGVVDYNVEAQDYTPVGAKLNTFKDAQAVFQPNALGPHTAGPLKALRQLGNNIPWLVAAATSLTEIVNIAGIDYCKDLSTCSLACYVKDDPKCPPVAKELLTRIEAKYGADYSVYINAGENLWVLRDVIQEAQSFDPTAIKNKWESMNTVDTIYGAGKMGGAKTCGMTTNHYVTHPQHLEVVKDGKVVSAGWIDFGALP